MTAVRRTIARRNRRTSFAKSSITLSALLRRLNRDPFAARTKFKPLMSPVAEMLTRGSGADYGQVAASTS
jgi:hypothetical protein